MGSVCDDRVTAQREYKNLCVIYVIIDTTSNGCGSENHLHR